MSRARFGALLCALAGLACAEEPAAPKERSLTAAASPGLRRLSVAEIGSAMSRVVGASVDLGEVLPPDARQQDFSRNRAQTVDSLLLGQLYDAVRAVADDYSGNQGGWSGCGAAGALPAEQCRREVVAALARAALRRPATEAELDRLSNLLELGEAEGDLSMGVSLVVRALLGSSAFLYAHSLGEGATERGFVRLSDAEIASELSFFVAGAPPDDELLALAAGGELRSGAVREREARRLLALPESRYLYRRFVEEWLGLYRLSGLAKSSAVVSDFPALRAQMLEETRTFVDDVLIQQGGSLSALLAGGYSFVSKDLAELYGIAPVPQGTRVSLEAVGRIGLLQHASFLSTFAHEGESAPVLRGKAVLERVLCRPIPRPQELGIEVVPPAPDPEATTRERFTQHTTDPACQGCHSSIDPVGFTFEGFDAVGRRRSSEAGKPVDESGAITLDGLSSTLGDSVELSRALAESEEARACLARQVVRFAAGTSDAALEDEFVLATSELPFERRATLLGLFLEFAGSDAFVWRKAE